MSKKLMKSQAASAAIWAVMLASGVAGNAWASIVPPDLVVDATDRGWIQSSGNHITSNLNYRIRADGTQNGFMVFDLPDNFTATSASFRVNTFQSSMADIAFLNLGLITTSPQTLIAGIGGQSAFFDLENGNSFGSATFLSAPATNSILTISFQPNGISALNNAHGGLYGFGMSLSSNDANADLFSFSSTGVLSDTQLLLWGSFGPVASDITAQGTFLTSNLGGSVNPAFDGGTLTGDAPGTIAQNFTVTGNGGVIDSGSNPLTFGGSFTNAISGTAGNLIVVGNGPVTFTGGLGADGNPLGTLFNGGTVVFGAGSTSWFTGVHNNNMLTVQSGGTVNDDLSNTGTVNNAGVYNANVTNFSATAVINNQATGVWTGDVLSNTTGATINNDGSWTGDADNAAILNNNATGTWIGDITNEASGTLTSTGVITGNVTNSGSANLSNGLNGSLTNNAGTTTISAALSGNGSGVTNNGGTIAVNSIFTGAGAVANNAALNVGVGAYVGATSVNNSATGTIANDGTINSDSTIQNSGQLTSTGVLRGGLNNQAGGVANVQGSLGGNVINRGTFTATGVLASNGAFTNAGTGVTTVDAASDWTGLTSFDQSSTAANGLVVNGWVPIDGLFIARAGSSTLVGALGELKANNANNAATSTITNNGIVRFDVTNFGTVANNAGGQWFGTVSQGTGSASNAGNWQGNFIVDQGGSVTNTGIWNNTGLFGSSVNNGTFTNSGTLTGQGASVTSANATFTNQAAGIINIGANTLTASGGGEIINQGRVAGRGFATTGGSIDNQVGAVWTGAITTSATGDLNNDGTINGFVTNAGTFTSTGIVGGGLNNLATGSANVRGTLNGTISNAGGLTVSGNLASNGSVNNNGTGTITLNNGANWTGVTTVTNNSTATDGLLVNGALSANNVTTNAGAFTRVGSTGSLTVPNQFTTLNIRVSAGGTFQNQGVVNGGMGSLGTVINDGTWTGLYAGDPGSVLTNNGTWNHTGNFFFTVRGSVTNSATGKILGNPIITAGTAATNFVNLGLVDTTAITVRSRVQDGSLIDNRATWQGGFDVFTGGRLINSGSISGLVNATAGTTVTNSGSIGGRVINAGTLTSNGALNAGLTNSGTANVSGTVASSVLNSAGNLNVTGNFTGGSILDNFGTGAVNVASGVTWSGVAGINNTSTNPAGISVDGTLTTTGDVANGGNAFIWVNAGGVLNAANVSNSVGGHITVAQGGTVNDALTNAGIVDNAGAYNADVNNSGVFALITNEATGRWTGNVLSNVSDAVIDNAGRWDGNADSAAVIQNQAAAEWRGTINNQAAGTLTNAGVVYGRVTNAGTTTSSGTLLAGLSNSGTANVWGTINGSINNSAGNLNVLGNLASTSVLTNDGTGAVTVASGANWTGLTGINNSSSNPAGIAINGTVTTAGLVSNGGSAFIWVNAGGTLTAGNINNSTYGQISVAQGGTVNDSLTNHGIVTNAGAYNADVTNSGSLAVITNAATGVWTGDVWSNDSGATINNAGAWTGDADNNAANINVMAGGIWTGDLASSGASASVSNAGTWLGDLDNASSSTVSNSGTWTGDANNEAIVWNQASGTWTGDLNNDGASAVVTNVAGGTWTGDILTNTSGATVNNGGTWTGTTTNAANVNNWATGTLIGNVTNTASGNFANDGTLTGTLNNQASAVATNAGSISGLVTNAGSLTSGGTLSAGLNNTATAKLSGTANGAINNSAGILSVEGALASNDVLNNSGTGIVWVKSGNAWTGLTAIANSSSSASGITVDGTLTTAGNLTNASGAIVMVRSGGTLTAANVDNANGAWIVVAQGGTVNDTLGNSGNVSNSGTYNADVNNNGGAANIANTATGVWNGNILSNTNGATIGNSGIWNGNATNSANMNNWTGATFNGNIINNAASAPPSNNASVGSAVAHSGIGTHAVSSSNGILLNQGAIVGTVTNFGMFTNTGTGTVSGLVTNTGTTANAGTFNGGLLNTDGTTTTTGTINAGVTNSATLNAQGATNGALVNQGAGLFTVTGALTGNGSLTNTGTASVQVTGGNFTGLTSVLNASSSATGLWIANGRTFGATSVTNAGGATIVNQGTLTTTAGTTNVGTLLTSNTLNGGINNAGSGVVRANGAVNGAVGNAGQFIVTGALTSTGGAFNNGATGQLINAGSVYSGLGAIANAGGGQITLGNGVTNATLAGASMINGGVINMRNGLIGDRVNLSGTYSGGLGTLSADVNMASNSNLSDRLTAANTAGANTTISIQNVGGSKIYFSNPIVIVAGSTTPLAFVAANDAGTQAALASNGIVDYAARQLIGSNNWGIVASVNNARVSSLGNDALGVAGVADLGQALSTDDMSVGGADKPLWSHHVWARGFSANQTTTTINTSTDPYAVNGGSSSEVNMDGYRVGGSLRVFSSGGRAVDVGVSGGQMSGRSEQAMSGLRSDLDMPVYGAHAIYTGTAVQADVQYDVLDLTVNPDNSITMSDVSASGHRVRINIGLPTPVGNGMFVPFARHEQTVMELDPLNLTGGVGTLSFDSAEVSRNQLGVTYYANMVGNVWTFRPSIEVSAADETASGASHFMPVGGASGVDVAHSREGTWVGGQLSLMFVHNASGAEFYVQAQGRSGADLSGGAALVGARWRF